VTSIRKNILLNSINIASGIIFPIITFPYAARVLLPNGIGAIEFLNSIINYIILFTSLGIPLYAVKEISKYRDEILKRNQKTVEILILSFILCLLGYIVVWVLSVYVTRIHQQYLLFYILSSSILFTSLGVNWFYQAIEDFKFITIRAIIIRTLSAISLFLFVKSPDDIYIYGIVIVGSTVGNNIINFIHLRKHIDIKEIRLKKLHIFNHVSPAFKIFILNLIISLYIQLNSVMLGIMSGDEQVGIFAASTKITNICTIVITSLGTVLLPRCSHMLKIGDFTGFSSIINKSLNITLAISLPVMVGLIILSRPIILLFCGTDFYESINVLHTVAPIVVFISLTNLMGIQILYPQDKINIVIWSVSGGALCNILFNILLIPKYGVLGAAFSTLLAEFSVFLIQLFLGHSYFPFNIRKIINIPYILSSIIMGTCIYIILIPFHSPVMELVIGVLLGILIYSVCLFVIKDELFMYLIKSSISFVKHHEKKV